MGKECSDHSPVVLALGMLPVNTSVGNSIPETFANILNPSCI